MIPPTIHAFWVGLLLGLFSLAGCADFRGKDSGVVSHPSPDLALDARLAANVIIVRLENRGGPSIWVDREMVFELYVEAHDSQSDFVNMECVGPVRRPPTQVLRERFVLLKAGCSIERRIPLSEPFRYFSWAKSFPQERVTGQEMVYMLPEDKDIREVAITWTSGSEEWDAIRYYLHNEGVPKASICRPLRTVVPLVMK